ncbi:MAG: hypothetical protein DMG81_04750 [Acidobacteria bacterium]|nr:MAG: hypothetical protein DMG81_04750 [Acidobacteriota bacterium]
MRSHRYYEKSGFVHVDVGRIRHW